MGNELLSAKTDIVFKKIFIENEDLLQDFLANMLDIPVKDIMDIEIKNTEIQPDSPDGKVSRLDLNMTVNEMRVNVEIQVRKQTDYKERSLFYWSKLFTSDFKSGDPYRKLKKTITINLIDFNMFLSDKSYHTEIVPVIKGTDTVFSDKMSIHFFELRKVGRELNADDRKKIWLQFINADKEEEFKMLEDSNIPEISKAVRVIRDMSADTKMKEAARQREKELHDHASWMEDGIMMGREQGLAEGMAKGRAEGIAEGRAEGMAEGRAKGIAEGRAEGEEEGKRKTIAKMIEQLRNFGATEEEINNMVSAMV